MQVREFIKKWALTVVIVLFVAYIAYDSIQKAMKPGTVFVSSNPTAAQIFLDDKEVGRTPSEVIVEKGRHTFKVTKDGYDLSEQTLNVSADHKHKLDFELVALPASEATLTNLRHRVEALATLVEEWESRAAELLGGAGDEGKAALGQLVELRGEMDSINQAIRKDPAEALTLTLLRKEIEELQGRTELLGSDISRLYDLIKWLIGSAIVVALAMIGYIVQLSKPHRSEST